MNNLRLVSYVLIATVMLSLSSAAIAGDFDWMRDLNLRASTDASGFRAQLSTRFNIGDAEIKVVLGNVDHPADAYMVFRLGEMSSMPYSYVLNKYKAEKGKGWGSLAKSLGIKPGSREFHILKQGSDIDANNGPNHGHKKDKKNKK